MREGRKEETAGKQAVEMLVPNKKPRMGGERGGGADVSDLLETGMNDPIAAAQRVTGTYGHHGKGSTNVLYDFHTDRMREKSIDVLFLLKYGIR